MGERRS
ncbi:hypothetical protein LINPERHAP1_LOCUS17225 [Linum perenne]